MLRNLASSLLLQTPTDDHPERVITSAPKAKAARRLVEKVITLGKKAEQSEADKDKLHYRRRAMALLHNQDAVKRTFEEIAPRFVARPGGYTRILRLTKNRLGDDASRVIFELVSAEAEVADTVRPKLTLEEEPSEETPEAPEPEARAEEEPGEEECG